jgi:hypothetical protein
VTLSAAAGRNSLELAGILGHARLLRAGRLVITASAVDAAGQRSGTRTVRLTLRR